MSSSSEESLAVINLEQANLWFGSHFFDSQEQIVNLKPGGYVEPVFEHPRDKHARPVSIILRKEHTNALGMDDNHYYYIIYRKRPLFRWSEDMGKSSYRRKSGIFIPFCILKHIDNNGLKTLSDIVLVLGNGKIHMISSETAFKFFIQTLHMKTVINYDQEVTALPLELFTEFAK